MTPSAVSVIVEGDNEPHCPESEQLCLGLRGLLEQDFPLNLVDLIMVGGQEQIERWRRQTVGMPFARVRLIPAEGVDYFQMKQAGAELATSSIIAFVDSDVYPSPHWLTTLVETIESGFDVSAGLTQLRWHGMFGPGSPLMLALGSVSWGAIQGPAVGGETPAIGFHSNNVGFRADLLQVGWYKSGLLRACAAHGLFQSWTRAGRRVAFRPKQHVVHAFTPDWWAGMHARGGMESLLMRRLFPNWPHRWVSRLKPLEPMLTAAWRSWRDPKQWWRYGSAVGLSKARRIAMLPAVVAVSILTRSVEMLGAYRGMLRGDLQRELVAHRQAGL